MDNSQDSIEAPKSLGEVFLEFLGVVAKRQKFLFRFIFVVTAGTAVIVLLSPKWYKATASVFPAESADLFGGLDGVSSLVKSFSPSRRISSLTGPSELDRYIAILKSERALMSVIEKFDLAKVYDITSYVREKTMKELLSNVEFEESEEGNLLVAVYDKDPQRAAAMANYFIEVLNQINSNLGVQNARANREFIDQRYQKNLQDIQRAQDAMKEFQLHNGVVAVPEQIEASIKAGAEIAGQLSLKEIELAVLKRTMIADHPSVKSKQIEVEELRRKIKEMNSEASDPEKMKILVPFKDAPNLAGEYVRLLRDAEIQYKILQYIAPLYEQAKVEEKRNTPSVVILDYASVPERKAKPKISLYALISFVSSSLIGLLLIFILEANDRLKFSFPDKYSFAVSSFHWKSLDKVADMIWRR